MNQSGLNGTIPYVNNTGGYQSFGIGSINGDETTSQLIVAGSGTTVSTSNGTTTITATSSAGTVTSVGLTQTGTYFTITNTPITTSGNINIAVSSVTGTGTTFALSLNPLFDNSITVGNSTPTTSVLICKGTTATANAVNTPLVGCATFAGDVILSSTADRSSIIFNSALSTGITPVFNQHCTGSRLILQSLQGNNSCDTAIGVMGTGGSAGGFFGLPDSASASGVYTWKFFWGQTQVNTWGFDNSNGAWINLGGQPGQTYYIQISVPSNNPTPWNFCLPATPGFIGQCLTSGGPFQFQRSLQGGALTWANPGGANTTTASSASIITMNIGSSTNQTITGSTAQTILLPVTNGSAGSPNNFVLQIGTMYIISNLSTAITTVNAQDNSTLISTIPAGGICVIVLLTNGTANGTWSVSWRVPSGAFTTSWGSATLNLASTTSVSSLVSYSATTGAFACAGSICMYGTTPTIAFAGNGLGPPAVTTRSVGTKLVLYPTLSGSAVDFGIGIDTSTLWLSVTTGSIYKFYFGIIPGFSIGINSIAIGNPAGTFSITILTPAISASYTITLPTAVPGGNGYALTATTAGVCSWTSLTVGTVTSVSSNSTAAAFTLNTATGTTTPAITLAYSGTALPIANGGTGLTSVVSSSQVLASTNGTTYSGVTYGAANVANTIMARDGNSNAFADQFNAAQTTIASGGAAINMSVTSSQYQLITGSSLQTIVLPDVTTLNQGQIFYLNNNSTLALTVNIFGGTLLTTCPGGGFVTCYNSSIVSNVVGSWDFHYDIPTNSQWGSGTLSTPANIVGSGLLEVTNTTSVGNSNSFTQGTQAITCAGDLTFTGTNPVLGFTPSGLAPPTVTTNRSIGTRIILNPAFSNAASADYAIGVDTNNLWLGTSTNAKTITLYNGLFNSATFGYNGTGGYMALTNGNASTISLSGAATGTSYTITLPGTVAAGNGYALTSTTAGVCSWTALTVGTITSVGLTQTGTYFTITNTPITTSGNINIAVSSVTGTGTTFVLSAAPTVTGTAVFSGIINNSGTGSLLNTNTVSATSSALTCNGDISLYSTTISQGGTKIMWPASGNLLGLPTTTTNRSNGSKLVLYPQWVSGGNSTDYAIGVASSTLWIGTPGGGALVGFYSGVNNTVNIGPLGISIFNAAATFSTTIAVPALAANYTITLPIATGGGGILTNGPLLWGTPCTWGAEMVLGTWTPTLKNKGGTATFSAVTSVTSYYTVGGFCYCFYSITFTVSAGTAGTLEVDGLPKAWLNNVGGLLGTCNPALTHLSGGLNYNLYQVGTSGTTTNNTTFEIWGATTSLLSSKWTLAVSVTGDVLAGCVWFPYI